MKIKSTLLAAFALLILALPSCKKETTAQVQQTFDCSTQSTISANTTLGPGIYNINCNIEVQSPYTLTIAPGTTLVFGQGNQITVDQGASISAIGTSSNPITFKGSQATAGYWSGIFINSVSITNQFTYCTITGGGYKVNSGNNFGANVSIYQGTAGFTNCTVSNSSDAGFYFYGIYSSAQYVDGAIFNTFNNNAVTGNGSYPIVTFAAGAGSIGTGNTFTGNTNNSIAVQSETSNVSVNVTLSPLSVPYDFVQLGSNSGDVFDKTFTILPGTRILMGSGISLAASTIGTFIANGTSANPITIQGEQATTGYWGSLNVQSPNANSFQYCNVSGGGGTASYDIGASQRGLISTYMYIPSARTITVQHCTLSNSGSSGIYVSADAPPVTPTYNTADIATSNTFTNCSPNVQM